jgi:hypothetical protein
LRVEADAIYRGPPRSIPLAPQRSHKKKQGSRATEQDDELAPLQLIELHSISASKGRRGRISNWRRAVSGYRNGFTTYNSRRGSRRMWKMDEFRSRANSRNQGGISSAPLQFHLDLRDDVDARGFL